MSLLSIALLFIANGSRKEKPHAETVSPLLEPEAQITVLICICTNGTKKCVYEELRKRFIERSKIQQKIAMANTPTSDDLQNWIRARNNIVLAKF